MEKEIIRLLVKISTVSKQMGNISKDLDDIYKILQGDEFCSIIKFLGEKSVTTEDYD